MQLVCNKPNDHKENTKIKENSRWSPEVHVHNAFYMWRSSSVSSSADIIFSFVMNWGGSSRLDEPRMTSRFSFDESLCAARNSDRVAPPMTKTNIRWPCFWKSLDACFNTESLQRNVKSAMHADNYIQHYLLLSNRILIVENWKAYKIIMYMFTG